MRIRSVLLREGEGLRDGHRAAGPAGPGSTHVTLHPLAAEVARQLDDVRRCRGEYLALVAQGMHDGAARHDPRSPAGRPFWHLAAAHLHRLLEQAGDGDPGPDTETVTVAAIACIEYARDAGPYGLAKATVDRATAVCASLPSDCRTALRLHFERARLTGPAGDIAAAEADTGRSSKAAQGSSVPITSTPCGPLWTVFRARFGTMAM